MLLFGLNAFICANLFSTEYIEQMGSIEAAFISLARYISQNWGDLTWFPLWYGGIPYQNAYPPLLHLIVAAFSTVTHASPALSYHAVTAAFYCFGPVTLFWLAWRLSGAFRASLIAGLVYSLFSPSTLLIPHIRHDIGGIFQPRRLQTLIGYGEGPHVASMALLPLAVLLLDVALRRRKPAWYLAASLALASVVLTNWLGGAALAGAVVAYLISQPKHRARAGAIALAISVYAYALACPWIPPSTLQAVRVNAQRIGGPFTMTVQHLKYAGLLIVAVVALDLLLNRLKAKPVVRFGAVFTLLTGAVVLPAEWLGIFVLPQPERYHLELEMALVILAVFAIRPLFDGIGRAHTAALAIGLVLFCAFQAKTYRGFSMYHARPADMKTKVEYEAARWFVTHTPDQRVLSAGSAGWWMNLYGDTPQIGGGFDQGLTNPLLPVALYQVYSGEGAGTREGEIAELWLRAFGVSAVFVPGRNGRAYYKDYRNPAKFEGRFDLAWRSGDDAIWTVPQRSSSLAHVMLRKDLPARAPAGGLDVDPLRSYVAALENPSLPAADMRWVSRHSAAIRATLEQGQILSVQLAYHPGWHAYVAGRPVSTWRDNLNQLAIDPTCTGDCTVQLAYDGGLEMALCRVLAWAGLLGGIVWCVADLRRRHATQS